MSTSRSSIQPAHKATWQGGKYYLTLLGSVYSRTHQSGDHYYGTGRAVTHYERLGWINFGRFGLNTLFRFWAPQSRLNYGDESLDRAIFGFEGASHYRKLALSMVPADRQIELIDWVVDRIFTEIKRKKSEHIDDTVNLGCLPYEEFVSKFCSELTAV